MKKDYDEANNQPQATVVWTIVAICALALIAMMVIVALVLPNHDLVGAAQASMIINVLTIAVCTAVAVGGGYLIMQIGRVTSLLHSIRDYQRHQGQPGFLDDLSVEDLDEDSLPDLDESDDILFGDTEPETVLPQPSHEDIPAVAEAVEEAVNDHANADITSLIADAEPVSPDSTALLAGDTQEIIIDPSAAQVRTFASAEQMQATTMELPIAEIQQQRRSPQPAAVAEEADADTEEAVVDEIVDAIDPADNIVGLDDQRIKAEAAAMGVEVQDWQDLLKQYGAKSLEDLPPAMRIYFRKVAEAKQSEPIHIRQA